MLVNLKELYRTKQYSQIVEICNAELRSKPTDSNWLAERGEVFLCVGDLQASVESYALADMYRNAKMNARPFLKRIGSIQWLIGAKQEAIATFRTAVDGILDGSIDYADAAGGVSHGLSLWFAGISSFDEKATVYARKFLGGLSHKSRA